MIPRLSPILVLLAVAFANHADAVPLRDLMDAPAPQERVYKTVKGQALKLFFFAPATTAPGEKRAAIVWIHGGAWVGGAADGFLPHARYCAARGAVGFSIAYRLAKPQGPTVADCLADCKSSLRFIRAHAAEFGVDANRIAVAGDSAGGHLAAALGTLDGFDDPADDHTVSARPDAMILYNPIVDMTEGDWLRYAVGGQVLANKKSPLEPSPESLALARSLSPIFQVHSHQPPMLLMHGLADTVVSPGQARRFAQAMRASGNRCDLVLLPDTGHAFVVTRYKSPETVVVAALRTTDVFLTSLGYFQGVPTLEVSPAPAWIPQSATTK